jgi:hypothetical protein
LVVPWLVVALLIILWPGLIVILISRPVITALKIHVTRGRAVAWPAIVTLAVIGTLAAIVPLAVRLLVALVEVVKREWERQRDAKANLRLSRVL